MEKGVNRFCAISYNRFGVCAVGGRAMNECKHGGYINDCAFCDNEKANGVNAVLSEVAPIKTGKVSNLGIVFLCGNCGSENVKLVVGDNGDYKHLRYCPDCGCKVDWRNFT